MYQNRQYNRADDSPSLLDLVLTNEENMIGSIKYLPGLSKSDHLQLAFNFNCYIYSSQHTFIKTNFFKGNYSALSNDLDEIDWDNVFDGLDLTDSWDVFTEKITSFVEKYIPLSRVSSGLVKRNPHADQQCREAIQRKHIKWKIYQYCKTPANYEIYKEARNRVNTEMRRPKYEYEKDLAL